jgi:hypothetical protein
MMFDAQKKNSILVVAHLHVFGLDTADAAGCTSHWKSLKATNGDADPWKSEQRRGDFFQSATATE